MGIFLARPSDKIAEERLNLTHEPTQNYARGQCDSSENSVKDLQA